MLELVVLEIAVYHPYISHFVIVVTLFYSSTKWYQVHLVSSPQQETPLHKASGEGHVRAVEYLKQAGADFNIKDGYGVRE